MDVHLQARANTLNGEKDEITLLQKGRNGIGAIKCRGVLNT